MATQYPNFLAEYVLLNAVAATGASDVYVVPQNEARLPRAIAWCTVFSGTPSAITAKIQGSLDNSNWFDLDTSTSTSGELRFIIDKPVKFVRANITSYTVNGSTATVQLMFTK